MGAYNYFSWVGSSVGENESITFHANNSEGKSNDQTVYEKGSSAINLDLMFFNAFENNIFTYWLTRKSKRNLGDSALAGAHFSVCFRSKDYQEDLY